MKLKKKIKPKIFWVGPFVPSTHLKYWSAASPAAMKWQKHLFDALVKKNVDIEWLYYRPDSYWPKGRLLPSLENIDSYPVDHQNQIHYLNILGFRKFTIKESLEKILIKKCENYTSQPLIIISYNGPEWIKKIFSNQIIIEPPPTYQKQF